MPIPDLDAVAVIIPAMNEAERIAATVAAALAIPGVGEIVVVDDGSTDATAAHAERAGATVHRHPRNRGKAAALTTGAVATTCPTLLFVDADLGETAAATAALIPPVLAGEAQMTVALLPRQFAVGGGRGRVVRTARLGIHALTGWRPTQPLSGIRCITRDALIDALPLASGWGVETGLTIDLLRAGRQVLEVPCDLQHRVSPASFGGAAHRAGQLRDVLRALAARGVLAAVLREGQTMRSASPDARAVPRSARSAAETDEARD